MKTQKRLSRISIFRLTLLIFVLIGIFASTFGAMTFLKSRGIIISQYTDSVQNQISLYLSRLDSELERIRQLQENLTIDEDIAYLKNPNIGLIDFDATKSVNRVISQLKNIQLTGSCVSKISIHFKNLERTLSSGLITYAELKPGYLKKMSDSPGNKLKFYDGSLHMITAPLGLNDYNITDCCVEATLSRDSIVSSLNSYNVTPDAISMILFEEFNLCYSSIGGAQKLYQTFASGNKASQVSLNGKNYLVISYYSQSLHATYAQFIPEQTAFAQISDFSPWFLFFGGAMVLVALIYCIVMYRFIKRPVDKLTYGFGRVERGDFSVRLTEDSIRDFSVIYENFNGMVHKLKFLIDNKYVQEILTQKAELRQLQAQVNPHFLYNSFFNLKKRISAREYEDAKKFCEMLGLYFNYITKNYNDSTTLEDEVAHAKIYADIQAMRFKDRIQVEFGGVPDAFSGLSVPRLILQPILENSFKYGLEEIEFDGLLLVSFEEVGSYLLISIEDNSENCSDAHIYELNRKLSEDAAAQEITALININRRIQLFCDNSACGLNLSRSRLGGLKVVLKLYLY